MLTDVWKRFKLTCVSTLAIVGAFFLAGCDPANEPNLVVEAVTNSASMSPERAAEIKAAALKLFDYQEGHWNSKWEWLGPDGDILGTMQGTETFKSIIDENAQMLKSVVPAFEQTAYALLTYNEVEHKIIFMNAGAGGDYWIMKQDPETGTMVSEPHTNPDGTTTILRFTILRQTPDEMDIQMDSSKDGGQVWVVGFKQYMKRVKRDG